MDMALTAEIQASEPVSNGLVVRGFDLFLLRSVSVVNRNDESLQYLRDRVMRIRKSAMGQSRLELQQSLDLYPMVVSPYTVYAKYAFPLKLRIIGHQ